jgi:hypothetical protein
VEAMRLLKWEQLEKLSIILMEHHVKHFICKKFKIEMKKKNYGFY